ncbi:MAG: UTP--glucose-1-phosphate uridylyltransferase [Deltaproteobacteria bacterium]|nr:UTP--glucose-1-phosphate uridylyltransferase [Deltaproteobacteria bacterium]
MDVEAALVHILGLLSEAGVGRPAAQAFARMYRSYRSGTTGRTPWDEVQAVGTADLQGLAQLEARGLDAVGRRHLCETAWIVLNGGLGTSMRMDRAKSLVTVKGGATFLDLLARHVLERRAAWGCDVPVLFMDSFATHEDTLRALAPYPLAVPGRDGAPLPLDFVQHRFPRILERDGLPLGSAEGREDWAPPGHGDLYLSLRVSGLLEALLERGTRWAFLSNVDNLSASLDPAILGLLASERYEFLMEVTPKTSADRKGGTLVHRRRRLDLLELAQVPEDHQEEFQDPERFPVFNTNNLWIDLRALEARSGGDGLELPLIVNRKTVRSERVIQLETAMGAAIGTFERVAGVLVPRGRFAPVKTTDDLLVRRSDAYVPGDRAPLVPNPARDPSLGPPLVQLDPTFFGSVPDLDLRIPDPPSLVDATSLAVVGDVRFGRGVVVKGAVRIENSSPTPVEVPDGALLEG